MISRHKLAKARPPSRAQSQRDRSARQAFAHLLTKVNTVRSCLVFLFLSGKQKEILRKAHVEAKLQQARYLNETWNCKQLKIHFIREIK